MRIRTIVPALAVLAALPLTAAETTGVKVGGFVDTSFSITEDQKEGNNFWADAEIQLGMTITDKVSLQVDLEASNAADGDSSVALDLEQAYGTWKLTPELTLKSGKFTSAIGWIAADAPGLYKVGAGPVFGLYGSDEVGASVVYAKEGMPATLEFAVTNGFFGEPYNQTDGSPEGQGKHSLAYTADVTIGLESMGNIDLELVYDVAGGREAADTGSEKNGDALHAAINATLTPVAGATLGFEAIYQTLGAADDAPATDDKDQTNLGLLGLVNYKVEGQAFPMSVTGSVQYVSVSDYDDAIDTLGFDDSTVDFTDATRTELAVALLTNPAGTDRFGLNVEVAYLMDSYDYETGAGKKSDETENVSLAIEAIYVLP